MTTNDELRAIAKAATPGPWRAILPGDLSWGERRKYRCVLFDRKTDEDTSPMSPANARHIATFDPRRALAALDVIEAAQHQRDTSPGAQPELVAALTRWEALA